MMIKTESICVIVLVLLTCLLLCNCSETKQDELSSSARDNKTVATEHKKLPPKAVILIDYITKSSRYSVEVRDGKEIAKPIFKQNISDIKKDIESRLNERGYKVIKGGNSYDAILHIRYIESISSVPHWGDTQYEFGFTLEDKNGVKLLDQGNGGPEWQFGQNAIFDYRYLVELVDAGFEEKDKFLIYLPYLQQREYITRVISILAALKDARTIKHIVPLLRDDSEIFRVTARKALVSLGYEPASDKDKAAMLIVRLARGGGDIRRHQEVIKTYGMPAINLFLEDLGIQPGPNYANDIGENARYALEVVTKGMNQEWNSYVVDKLLDVLKNKGKGAKHKESYIKDAMYVLAEIADRQAIEQIRNYLTHEELADAAKYAIGRIEKRKN